MRCCKVVVSYFGPRRNFRTNNPKNAFEFFKLFIKTEQEVNPGLDRDLIIINNEANHKEGNDYIHSLNQTEINRGKIIIQFRANEQGSFGGYNFAFSEFMNDYDMWLFTEDDHIFFQENYYKIAVDELESANYNGFLALGPINFVNKRHGGGGIGLTTTFKLLCVQEKYGSLVIKGPQYPSIKKIHQKLEYLESYFTSPYEELGYQLLMPKTFSSVCSNWKNVPLHRDHVKKDPSLIRNDTFLYYIGPLV